MYLYWITSKERNVFFFISIFFLLLTSIFIISESLPFLIVGLAGIVIHRILLILYIIKLNKVKDFVPILIAVIPFIFIFSYLLSISDEIPKESYYPLVIQNILVSILGGVVLSNYFMNETKNTPWLSIFGVLSIALYFIVFIEKCFLPNLPPTYFRPLGMILYVTSYYAFYKFVIDTERLNADVNEDNE
jgi:predicted neutral ceramidase superfamily lipid hydrolase